MAGPNQTSVKIVGQSRPWPLDDLTHIPTVRSQCNQLEARSGGAVGYSIMLSAPDVITTETAMVEAAVKFVDGAGGRIVPVHQGL